MGSEKRVARLTMCDSGTVTARRAIALDSSLADGYSELAWASLNRLDFSTAEAAARRAEVFSPAFAEARADPRFQVLLNRLDFPARR